MPNRNTDGGRTPLTGRVDFTMMYVAHDAFTRDLQRLTAAAGAGQTASPAVQAGWAMLKKQLHIHHTTEDTSLWPALRQKATRPDHVAVIDAMEAEHARIDPQLNAVDQPLASSDAISLTQSAQARGLPIASALAVNGQPRNDEPALPADGPVTDRFTSRRVISPCTA